MSLRNQKGGKDFISDGTPLNEMNSQAVKRIGKDFEVSGTIGYEEYNAPICVVGSETVTSTTIQFIWFPQRETSF